MTSSPARPDGPRAPGIDALAWLVLGLGLGWVVAELWPMGTATTTLDLMPWSGFAWPLGLALGLLLGTRTGRLPAVPVAATSALVAALVATLDGVVLDGLSARGWPAVGSALVVGMAVGLTVVTVARLSPARRAAALGGMVALVVAEPAVGLREKVPPGFLLHAAPVHGESGGTLLYPPEVFANLVAVAPAAVTVAAIALWCLDRRATSAEAPPIRSVAPFAALQCAAVVALAAGLALAGNSTVAAWGWALLALALEVAGFVALRRWVDCWDHPLRRERPRERILTAGVALPLAGALGLAIPIAGHYGPAPALAGVLLALAAAALLWWCPSGATAWAVAALLLAAPAWSLPVDPASTDLPAGSGYSFFGGLVHAPDPLLGEAPHLSARATLTLLQGGLAVVLAGIAGVGAVRLRRAHHA